MIKVFHPGELPSSIVSRGEFGISKSRAQGGRILFAEKTQEDSLTTSYHFCIHGCKQEVNDIKIVLSTQFIIKETKNYILVKYPLALFSIKKGLEVHFLWKSEIKSEMKHSTEINEKIYF